MKRMSWICLLIFGFIWNGSAVFAADLYVESSGSCGGKTPCYSTIQEAINAADSGDTIKLAQGIYAETFVLNSDKQLILQGGWDAGFTNQTPGTTAIRAPIITIGAMAFQELRIMEIAGPMGNATIADVLDGKTFSSDAGTGFIGTMPNRGGMSYTPTTTDQTIVVGYYNGSGKVEGDSNLVSGNIRSGVSIFGVEGATNVVDTSSGDAVGGDILKDKKAWVAGSEVTGTLSTKALSADSTTVEAGNYAATTLNTVDPDLATGNIKKDATIFGVAGKTQVVDTTEVTNPVVEGRMKTGDVAFVNGNKITGTGTKELSAADDSVAEGYYAATTLNAVDPDLVEGNIKSGVDIFGKTGTFPSDGTAVAGEVKTGSTFYTTSDTKLTGNGTKTLSSGNDTVAEGYYAATTLSAVDTDLAAGNIKNAIDIFGVMGELHGGCDCSGGTLVRDRYCDHGDGTVTDLTNCLVWLKNANCFGMKKWVDSSTWDDAQTSAGTLKSVDCGLSDGSEEGDWRLPTLSDLKHLTTGTKPILTGGDTAPFSDVQSSYYWSSSTDAGYTDSAWSVYLSDGLVDYGYKSDSAYYVWPVRSDN